MQLELFVDAKIANLCLVKAKLCENEPLGLKMAKIHLNCGAHQALMFDHDKPALVQRCISSWVWIKECYARDRPPVKSAKVLSDKNLVLTPLAIITRLVRNYKALINEFCKIFSLNHCKQDIRYLALAEIYSAYHRLHDLKRGLLVSMKNQARKTLTYVSD